ncbi:AGE family epimerase/isomerase [Ruminococcus champanellensis]|nr:AGE family epimerase/isomerase [Ruminococcus champanellensis]
MLRNEEMIEQGRALAADCRRELTEHILPFWNQLSDPRGGFYGRMDAALKLYPDAPKGVILHARILWAYSSAYLALQDPALLEHAAHAYRFLRTCCYDKAYGGMFWSVTAQGEPCDTIKHTYNQAFCIYGLCAYYRASGDVTALELAEKLFDTIEKKTPDAYGYGEAFTRDWQPADNEALSENGLSAVKTMNTVLHLVEAYTELYRVTRREQVAQRLRWLLDLTRNRIYDPERCALRVFFDGQWNEIGDVYSYGHDIEASWLLTRACDVLEDETYTAAFAEIAVRIAGKIQSCALEQGALNDEYAAGNINKKRVWWVEAEGVVGFLNAYQLSGDPAFFRTAQQLWRYIRTYQIDRREGGEWHAEVAFDNVPMQVFDMAGPWKCPYHNSRMCLETMQRIRAMTQG